MENGTGKVVLALFVVAGLAAAAQLVVSLSAGESIVVPVVALIGVAGLVLLLLAARTRKR